MLTVVEINRTEVARLVLEGRMLDMNAHSLYTMKLLLAGLSSPTDMSR